jgi:DMSO reductase anchor subunit
MERASGASGPPSRLPTVLQVAACLLAAAGSAAALLLPVMTQETVSNSPGTTPEHTVEQLTLLQTHPPTVLIPLAVPLLLTLVPLLMPRRAAWPAAVVCTILLFGFIVLAIASVGSFYLPALAAALTAVVLPRTTRLPHNRNAV